MAGTKFGLVLAFLAASLVLPAAVSAQAEGSAPAKAPASAMRGDKLAMFRATGIDKEQETKLFALTKDFEETMIPKTQALVGLLREMQALSLKPDPDHNLVLAKQAEINKANGDISIERIKFAIKMRGVLSPEQKKKFVDLMQQSYAAPDGAAPEASAK